MGIFRCGNLAGHERSAPGAPEVRECRHGPRNEENRRAVEGRPLTHFPDSLLACLRAHAAAGPHRPWLFTPHGWDWRWLAWGEAEARVAAATAELAPRVEELAAGVSRPPRLAFAYRPRPACVLLDLAIQATGAVAVPRGIPGSEEDGVSGPSGEPENVDAWVEQPTVLDLERPAPREVVWPEGLPAEAPGGLEGGVAVREADGSWREISPVLVAAAARELGERIRRPRPGSPPRDPASREIVVSVRPLDDPGERLLLAWALWSGAAVVLEPRLGAHVATALWVRPTVFAGNASEVEALARGVESYRSPVHRRLGRWLRRRLRSEVPEPLPLDRLHTILVSPPAEPPSGAAGEGEAEERAELREVSGELGEGVVRAWEDRGVRVLGLPSGLDAALWREVV